MLRTRGATAWVANTLSFSLKMSPRFLGRECGEERLQPVACETVSCHLNSDSRKPANAAARPSVNAHREREGGKGSEQGTVQVEYLYSNHSLRLILMDVNMLNEVSIMNTVWC